MTMNPSPKTLALALLGLALLAGGVTAVSSLVVQDGPPPLPANGLDAAIDVVYVRPFVTDQPFTHWWRAERPTFDAGVLLVLSVADPALLHPRQTAEPVLFVGEQTAERLNAGHESGQLVVLVPAERDGQGGVALDLSAAPIFFDRPALPETVDAAAAQAALQRALAAGLTPPDRQALAAVSADTVRFSDIADVHLYAADLIEAWSPQEVDLVAGLRAPRLPR